MTRRAALGLAFLAATFITQSFAQNNSTLEVGGGRIEVDFTTAPSPEFRQRALAWVGAGARAVAGYYGKFPVPQVRLRINTFGGRGVRGGQTFGWPGAHIRIAAGNASTAADFADDWMMTHEMIHLAFPSVADQHHWIEEGLSTYVEPIARARAGELTATRVWADLVDGLPKGLPKSGDRGLDNTPTWGRTYWGGALFCLLADIEIRKRTENQKGLEHAMRAILREGGTIEADWDLTRALEVGDRAIGVPVLEDLYRRMKATPMPVDLDATWNELGIKRRKNGIEFDDTAPLAPIRQAITRG